NYIMPFVFGAITITLIFEAVALVATAWALVVSGVFELLILIFAIYGSAALLAKGLTQRLAMKGFGTPLFNVLLLGTANSASGQSIGQEKKKNTKSPYTGYYIFFGVACSLFTAVSLYSTFSRLINSIAEKSLIPVGPPPVSTEHLKRLLSLRGPRSPTQTDQVLDALFYICNGVAALSAIHAAVYVSQVQIRGIGRFGSVIPFFYAVVWATWTWFRFAGDLIRFSSMAAHGFTAGAIAFLVINGFLMLIVYALAASCKNPQAIEKIYNIKRGAADRSQATIQPPPVGVHEECVSRRISCIVSKGDWLLKLGVGAAYDRVGTKDSIMIRVPDHTVTVHLCELTGPLAITSANPSGEPDSTHHSMVLSRLGHKIQGVLCDGDSNEVVAPQWSTA
ncbi:hypothetical protein CRUP_033080, partial [Coryphaenoides rupestris]